MIVHGDDFLVGGSRREVERFREEMNLQYEAKHQTIGPGGGPDNRMKVLNREIVWHDNKITIEADAKRVKAVLKDLGLEEAMPVKTPGVKDRCDKVQQDKERQKEGEEAEKHREPGEQRQNLPKKGTAEAEDRKGSTGGGGSRGG